MILGYLDKKRENIIFMKIYTQICNCVSLYNCPKLETTQICKDMWMEKLIKPYIEWYSATKNDKRDKLLIYLKDTVLSEIAILKGHIYVQLQLYGIFKNTKL